MQKVEPNEFYRYNWPINRVEPIKIKLTALKNLLLLKTPVLGRKVVKS
jgi:hypothetical protein